jgi:hypothetical protein
MDEVISLPFFFLAFVGYAMMQRQAIRENVLLGIGCLFFPPLLLYAAPAYWRSMQHGAILFLFGLLCGACWLLLIRAAA